MYVDFQSVDTDGTVQDSDEFDDVVDARYVELQASGNHIAYTMDGETDPSETIGMRLLTTSDPKTFAIEDFNNIKFLQLTGASQLNAHFIGDI